MAIKNGYNSNRSKNNRNNNNNNRNGGNDYRSNRPQPHQLHNKMNNNNNNNTNNNAQHLPNGTPTGPPNNGSNHTAGPTTGIAPNGVVTPAPAQPGIVRKSRFNNAGVNNATYQQRPPHHNADKRPTAYQNQNGHFGMNGYHHNNPYLQQPYQAFHAAVAINNGHMHHAPPPHAHPYPIPPTTAPYAAYPPTVLPVAN